MYESPINIDYGRMNVQLEGAILKAVQEVGVTVDKEELLAALAFDRNQYCKGYRDAVQERDLAEVVRCKDCKYQIKEWHPDNRMISKGYYTYGCDRNFHRFSSNAVNGHDHEFCSHGERRGGE